MRLSRGLKGAIVGFGAVACVAVTLVAVSLHARQNSDITPPSNWLPLTYEYTITSKGGVRRYVEYRLSDGSVRRDSLDIDEVQMTNVARQKFYRGHNGQWTESPMRRQPNEGRPYLQLKRETVTAVEPSDTRVQGVALSAGIPLSFYEFKAGDSTVVYCPELNMLDVWAHHGGPNGQFRERQVDRIVRGEPQVPFEPPQGASVQLLVDPAGPGSVLPVAQAPRSR